MRTWLAILAALSLSTSVATAQPIREIPPQFDLFYNPDLYGQRSPREVLAATIAAIERERFDYIVAHLLDPAVVDRWLANNKEHFDRVAAEQVAGSASGALLTGKELQVRIQDISGRLNVRNLASTMRKQAMEDPETLALMKRMVRDGMYQEAPDVASATLPDVKDRALYFKKIGDRWFLENRRTEKVGAKE